MTIIRNQYSSLPSILNRNTIDPYPNLKYRRLIYSHVYDDINNQDKIDDDEANEDNNQVPNVFAFDQQLESRVAPYFQFDILDNLIVLFDSAKLHYLYRINEQYYDDLRSNRFVQLLTKRIFKNETDNLAQNMLIRGQIYPYDKGFYSLLRQNDLNLYDTQRQFKYQTYRCKKDQFLHMDWNRLSCKYIALGCQNEQTLIYDIRVENPTLSLLVTAKSHKAVPNYCYSVYWSPIDECGLFIGTENSISIFDIRQPRKPLREQNFKEHRKGAVTHMSMTPDHQCLITMHLSSNNDVHYTRWKIKSHGQDFLKKCPLYQIKSPGQTCRNSFEGKFGQVLTLQHHQPFITNDTLTLFDQNDGSTDCINYSFRKSKKYRHLNRLLQKSKYLLKSNTFIYDGYHYFIYDKHPLIHGYGSTANGDEARPAIFYKAQLGFVVRRLRTTEDEHDIKSYFSKQCSQLNQDQWSDDSD